MTVKIAIVGFDISIGSCADARAFAYQLYEGDGLTDQSRTGNINEPSTTRTYEDVLMSALEEGKQSHDSLSTTALITVSTSPDESHSCKLAPNVASYANAPTVAKAIITAHDLLTNSDANEVLIGSESAEGCCAIALKTVDRARAEKNHLYVIIESCTMKENASEGSTFQNTQAVCRDALNAHNLEPTDIGYLEIQGGGLLSEDEPRVAGLINALSTPRGDETFTPKLTCALGSFRTSTDSTGGNSVMASLIKTVLCLHQRFIPAQPQWSGPKKLLAWKDSPFYVPTQSRTWFVPQGSKRIAALNCIESDKTITHMLLSDDPKTTYRRNHHLTQATSFCFPIAADNPSELIQEVCSLGKRIEKEQRFMALSKEYFDSYSRKQSSAEYALMITGPDQQALQREIRFLSQGIASAFEKKIPLKTPRGSYFTPNPLGAKGKIAYVYPGAASAYPGLGQDILHLCPQLYEPFSQVMPLMGEHFKENILYPRSMTRVSDDALKLLGRKLRGSVNDIMECGVSFAVLYSMMLRHCFNIVPQMALGYSVGEASMMASLGVWPNPVAMKENLPQSPFYDERFFGKSYAVRDLWNMPHDEPAKGKIWETFTLKANPDSVREAIKNEDKVYLTLINTPSEVVIAGHPASCMHVIEKMGCEASPLYFDLVVHSPPVHDSYNELLEFYNLPTASRIDVTPYSSGSYSKVPLNSEAIAHNLANSYCHMVDFPRLVNTAYDDGARIFIEIAPRNTCTGWIENILQNREHLAVPINIKGTKDYITLIKLLSQLVSHRIPVDLTMLYL